MRFALFARCAWWYRAILATGAAARPVIGIDPKRAPRKAIVAKASEPGKALLVHPAHHHQKPLKLGIVAGAFPEIDETANNLNVVEFVVSTAVDPVC